MIRDLRELNGESVFFLLGKPISPRELPFYSRQTSMPSFPDSSPFNWMRAHPIKRGGVWERFNCCARDAVAHCDGTAADRVDEASYTTHPKLLSYSTWKFISLYFQGQTQWNILVSFPYGVTAIKRTLWCIYCTGEEADLPYFICRYLLLDYIQ